MKWYNFSLYLILYLLKRLAEMSLHDVYEHIKIHNIYCNLVSKWKWKHIAIRIIDSLIDKIALSSWVVFHSLFIYISLSTCHRPATHLSSLVLFKWAFSTWRCVTSRFGLCFWIFCSYWLLGFLLNVFLLCGCFI